MTYQDKKRLAIIYMSAYNTNGSFTIDEWFFARKYVPNDKVCLSMTITKY